MKKILLLVLLSLWAVAMMGLTIEISEFEQSSSENPVILRPGAPQVPYLPVKILLPMGHELTGIEVEYSGETARAGVRPGAVGEPQPFSESGYKIREEDPAIYGSDESYPELDYKVVGIQRQNGYDLLLLHLYAWKYNPQSEEIYWQERAEIEYETAYNEAVAAEQSRKLLKSFSIANETIYNQQAQTSYIKQSEEMLRNLADPSEPYGMVLITSESASGWFAEYVSWKAEQGLETGVFFTEDIYAEYEGADNQSKIKNFIIDAYETWSGTDTPLEYVLLGGDDEIIPIRGVFIDAGGTVDVNLPADVYYSCLDDNWDNNGNGIYGEVGDEVDLIPEIAVGRIPADNEQDVINWFTKLVHYVDSSTYSNSVCRMVGEYLWGNPDTWGGDSMDLLLEVIDEPYHVETLYERDGTYSEYGVTTEINEGLGFLNHLGHANEGFVFGQTRATTSDYFNTEYGFGYSQGCYPAAFDEATGQASECIVENFIIRESGFFGFIGNSRYGWGIPGQPSQGPSQRYHMPFIEGIFEFDIREFGKALSYSRQVMADAALEAAHLRWVHYELTLMGDPSIALKIPQEDFPYLSPGAPIYDDVLGDGDGAINPGETIEISFPVTADFDWANAFDVTAEVAFADSAVILQSSVILYGDILSGETETAEPVVVTVPEDCNYDTYGYTVTLRAPVAGGGEFCKEYNFDFEVSLQQAYWPWYSSERLSIAPIVTDLDGDGLLDILASTMRGDSYGLDLNAELIPGYPWELGETIEKHTAYGDVDNDEEPEVVYATRDGNIYARNLDGSIAWQYAGVEDQLLTPVLADFDGDGILETAGYNLAGEVVILNEEGELEAGFPLEVGEICFKEMGAADCNGDGAAELAFATLNGNLHVIDYNAEELPGFPVALGGVPASGITILDNHHLVLGLSGGYLKIYSQLGELRLDKEISSNLCAAPIAADFDSDGELEIAYTTIFGEVGICKQDGTDLSGYPLYMGAAINQPPLAVDIDNQNGLDLIWFMADNSLNVYRNDGSEIEFSPVPVNYNSNFPASIADIDGDMDFEIVLSTASRLVIIDSKLRKGEEMPWSTYRGNLHRTGFFGDNELTDTEPDQLTGIDGIIANYPNPFNPETTISFELTQEASRAGISIYNVKGQKLYSQELSLPEAGIHQIVWQGKDMRGRKAASGVYFYQLEIDGKVCDSRRMLLLK